MSRDLKHPQDETLLDLAASQLDRPHQLVLEAHLEHCSACRKRVGELAAPGGWWLEQLPSEAPSGAVWERLEREVAAPSPPTCLLRNCRCRARSAWSSLAGGRRAGGRSG